MKIICVGRNYGDHIKELNNERPESPVIFLKPDSSVLDKDKDFYLPDFSNEIHHEVEIIFKIGKIGKNIQANFAHKYISEIGLGIDFTARDIQTNLKSKGLPWEISKGFDNSALIGKFKTFNYTQYQNGIHFSLENQEGFLQRGYSKEMIWGIEELIEYISRYFTLKVGDIIFSGTPAGVSKVNINDQLIGKMEGEEFFNIKIK